MSRQNVEVVRAIHEVLAKRDWEALDALMRDHLARDFTVESLVTGLTYKGAGGLRQLIDDIQDTVDYVPEVEEAVDLGEHVLVMLRSSGRGSQSGVRVTQRIAGLVRPQRLTHWFTEHRKAAGIPTGTLHTLRHTAATLALTAGVPVHIVAARLGDDPNTVLKT